MISKNREGADSDVCGLRSLRCTVTSRNKYNGAGAVLIVYVLIYFRSVHRG